MGGRLVEGSLELALSRYRRAAEIAPDNLVHHVEAARVLRDLQRREEAREALERALACEVRDVNGWHLAVDARGMLAEMEGREFEAPLPPHPATPRLEHEHSLAGVRVGRKQGGEGGEGGETGGLPSAQLSDSSGAASPSSPSTPAPSSASQFYGRA
ncbi:hypothetical protein H632_c3798p0 [Helicosporidium sp. ATCC 50920]|nr:hypothetical protein H632_c3798p0 [Helicosporidium sp. ATCC 50920]|eukprot:KDD72141.1 hypothetical protein H632_c3798p0 [Helicosporidium sp. ATCC 50920]